MNRLSTAGFVPLLPSVCIRFRLFVLLGKGSSDDSSMLWGVRGQIFLYANEQFYWQKFLPNPARLIHRAPRRDPPVLCPHFGLDQSKNRFMGFFLDMPCMKRVYRDKKALFIVWQPGTKRASRPASRPADKPLVKTLVDRL